MKATWTKESIVVALQDFYTRNGRAPRMYEMVPENGLPWHSRNRKIFGSHNNALKAAGLPTINRGGDYIKPPPVLPVVEQPPKITHGFGNPWTEEEAIVALRTRYNKYGALPPANMTGYRDIPSTAVLRRLFGTFNKAVEAAGIPTRSQGGSKLGRSQKLDRPRPTKFEGWTYDDREGNRLELKERTLGRRVS